VRPGDRVALLAAPSATAIALLVAAGRVGACVAPLGTRLAAPELAAAGREIVPRLAVHDRERAGEAALLAAPTVPLDALAGGLAGDPVAPSGSGGDEAPGAADLDPHAPTVAVLTSGTAGRPKVALLSHAALAASAAAWSAALPPATGWLLCLGLAHVAGLGVAWRALGAGVPLRIVPDFDPRAVLEALREGQVSHVSLVPTQLARLLDRVDAERESPANPGTTRAVAAVGIRMSSAPLRAVLLGGAPIPPSLVTRALAAGWPVVPTYGLTEAASGVTALATSEAASHPGSAGRPLPGVRLRIAVPAPDGNGEIQVRTPAAFSGYLARPEATAAAFTLDGWLRTGDAGTLDAEGFLHVLDRRVDLLVSGGENVVPAEVEAALEAHPAIAEAGVVGRPDLTWGAVPVAAVVLRPGVPTPSSAELRAFCRARLAPYKVPTTFVVVPALPRTVSGKLRRTELRAALVGAPRGGGESLDDAANEAGA
jgi:O-succinylbenzoic acid--CoA ligase